MKKNSSKSRWASIIVYNDDLKTNKEYKLNDEQKLLIPLKPMRRKQKHNSEPKDKPKSKDENNNSKIKCSDNKPNFEYIHNEILSMPELETVVINKEVEHQINECLSDSFGDYNTEDQPYYY